MRIDNNYSQNRYVSKSVNKPSFGAIHPTRYFVKAEDGSIYQIFDAETIKTLQRQLVTWLNKDKNNEKLIKSGKSPKPENALTKELRAKFVRFLKMHDSDYAANNVAKSFSENKPGGMLDSYIFTGASTGIIDSNAQKIVQVQSSIKDRVVNVSKQHFISLEEAKKIVKKEADWELEDVKRNYFYEIKEMLRKSLSSHSPKDSKLDVFYIPVKKGKKVEYKLYNARLQHSMG